jgi:uncharacterized membrane protein
MNWLAYATLSAGFAGLVAVLGKIGVRGWTTRWPPPSAPR